MSEERREGIGKMLNNIVTESNYKNTTPSTSPYTKKQISGNMVTLRSV
jgi:hypothetical protein